ncbi:phage major capsid protein, partial [Mesorhizobium sp. M7A.F.Ca.CA.004.01.1.1]|uniref:phage major capsid protein n=1 Tax=Mesorhizobium sp. M7A.F.Ca.CA.004.01.1.1 TaxID=2496689 RepID=UPI000FCAB0EB
GQGTVRGIDSATWTFCRNKFLEPTGTNLAASPSAANAASFKADMNKLWLALTRGADKPDIITFSHDFYSLYELGEQQLQRYMDADMAQSGFIGLKYKTADVIFDDNTNFTTTAEKGYFLNTDYVYVDQHKEAQWTQDDEKKPVNQDAVVIPFYWMGNLVTSNRSLQGVLFDAA